MSPVGVLERFLSYILNTFVVSLLCALNSKMNVSSFCGFQESSSADINVVMSHFV